MEEALLQSPPSQHAASSSAITSGSVLSKDRTNSRLLSRSQDRPIVVYASRWTALALFCSLNLTVATMWVTFAPISDDTSIYFDDVGTSAVNILAAIFQIMYLPGTYMCVLVMQKYGMRTNLLIAGTVTLLGALLRVLGTVARDDLGGKGAYAVVFMGQFLAALVQPMFVNVPAAFAGIWFPSDEREIATTITSLFNPLGNALGQLLPPMFVTERDDGSVQGMQDLMIVEAALIAVPLVVMYFFFEAGPPTPPSHAAQFKNKARGTHGSF
jgi:FLVCR family MFS transporter 7